MCICIELLGSLETFTNCPSCQRLHIASPIDSRACQMLEEANEVVGCLVVCELNIFRRDEYSADLVADRATDLASDGLN